MGGRDWDFDTLAVNAGTRTRVGDSVATVAPIVASTTFTGGSVEDVHAALDPDSTSFAYARNANPTVANLESVLATLEGADDAVAFGSGMAAIHAALMALELGSGDVIVAASDLYGATRTVFAEMAGAGIETRYIDISDFDAVAGALTDPDVRLLYFESIANPLLQVADVQRLAECAHRHRVTTMIDNTFATPVLLRPIGLGVDVVVHSATKYIAGHGDVLAGAVATSRSWAQRIRQRRTRTGAVLSPFEAWLTLRGVRTLAVRMERQCETAQQVAAWLANRSWVRAVHFPGLECSPYREIAVRQFGGRFGAMVTFELDGEREITLRFIDALELINPGTSLGDVGSLILYPALASHRGLTPEERLALGIGDSLLRLSVGLESVRDLISDLQNAAQRCGLSATLSMSASAANSI